MILVHKGPANNMYTGAVAIAFGIQTAPSNETRYGGTAGNLQKKMVIFDNMCSNDKE